MGSPAFVDTERAKQLLGSGISNELVATTLGCDPSYISQLMSQDDFREAVIKLRMQSLTAATERDRKIDSIEDQLITQLEATVQYLVKPTEIARTFMMVNAAKRRGVPSHESTIINNNIVNLQIPTVVLKQFQRNGLNEVVEVEGRPLITINSAELLRKVAQEQPNEGKRNELSKLADRLPSSIGREAMETIVSDS